MDQQHKHKCPNIKTKCFHILPLTLFHSGMNKHSSVIRCSLKVVSAAFCNVLNLRNKYGKDLFTTHHKNINLHFRH